MVEEMFNRELSINAKNQRLTHLLELDLLCQTAEAHCNGRVTISNEEGEFEMRINDNQRRNFQRILEGRLISSMWEGQGNLGYKLVKDQRRLKGF